MSRLAGLLVLALGSAAVADSSEPPAPPAKSAPAAPAAKASKFPLRVVKILMDSEQALLFDANRGRHVLVEVGDAVGDYTVATIAADEVTLTGKDMPIEVALPSPDAKPKAKPAPKVAEAAPEDPYADAATPAPPKPTTDAAMPADPYAEAEDEPVREASATAGDGDKVTTSPLASAEVPKPSDDVAKRGEMSTADETDVMADAMAAATKPAVANAPAKLARKDVTAALANFGVLVSAIDATFTAAGVKIAKVKAGSIFAQAGLTAGDVITAVDGKPLRTLDDAADLYARAGTMKAASVQIQRAGKPLTLRIAIQ